MLLVFNTLFIFTDNRFQRLMHKLLDEMANFSFLGGRWITPASDSFILGANILSVPTFIIFRSGSVSSL